MSDQFQLDGFGDAAPTDRLFFALLPDAPTQQRILALAQGLRVEHGLKGRPLDQHRLHITLHHVGDFAGLPRQLLDDVSRAAAGIAFEPIRVSFDRVASFAGKPRRKPLVLQGDEGIAQVEAFQKTLMLAMAKAGALRGKAAPYVPHLTLLYDDRSVAVQTIEPIEWTAQEFVLVNSLIGQSRHLPLSQWPLRG